MMVLETLEIVPPFIDPRMFERHRIDTVLGHQRMSSSTQPVKVKLFLEQSINQRVDAERRPGWSSDPQTMIEVKAAGAFNEKFNA